MDTKRTAAQIYIEIEDLEAEIKHQQSQRCKQMGALWNLLFPDERDDWDYPDQMYRLVFAQVFAMKTLIDRYKFLGPNFKGVSRAKPGQANHISTDAYEWEPDSDT